MTSGKDIMTKELSECPYLTPFLLNLHIHGLIVSLGLHEDLLQTQHSPQHIFIYKTSKQKHHQSLLSFDRFAIRWGFTLMHPISHSKCITLAYIKTYSLVIYFHIFTFTFHLFPGAFIKYFSKFAARDYGGFGPGGS